MRKLSREDKEDKIVGISARDAFLPKVDVPHSVADPGYLSQIPDPGSDFIHPGSELSPSRIPDPHQRI
jgi:hypothetical protein